VNQIRDWDDVFDGIPIQDQIRRRKRIAFHIGESTLSRDDREDLIDDLLDESIEFTIDDLDAMEVAARMNRRRPVDNYAPTQKEISAWIRSFCDL
jgi:hypothetical protein